MHQLLNPQEIAKWLDKITVKGGRGKQREGVSMTQVAKATGIPITSIRWFRNPQTAKMSAERQHALSRFIAEYENGIITFKGVGIQKRMVRVANPRPRVEYKFTIGPKGVSLRPADRPRIGGKMPKFKDLMGG